jgi:5'-3' exonuclease
MSYEVETYKYDTRRLMVVDWSSVAYQNIFSIGSGRNAGKYGVLTQEDELRLWRNKMVVSMYEFIQAFNPLNIIIAVDGESWRKSYVKQYYNDNAIVYYDDHAMYTEADNYGYKIMKCGETYIVERVETKKFSIFRNLKHCFLGQLPADKNALIWNLYEKESRPIIHSYKGKRKFSMWDVVTPKDVWRKHKDEFAFTISKFFRSIPIRVSGAEGDDVIYNSVQALKNEYQSIVIVTRDSDMLQIDVPNLKIYDHLNDNFMTCTSPSEYLATKILRGDSSDNIQGMSIDDPKNPGFPKSKQIGEKGAKTLLESGENVYEKAKREGWLKQYTRNADLIDLSHTPESIKEKIAELCIFSPNPPDDINGMSSLGITQKVIDLCINLRSRGFYSFLPADCASSVNISFENERKQQEAHIENIKDAMTSPISAPSVDDIVSHMSPENDMIRDFKKIDVFPDPLGEVPF